MQLIVIWSISSKSHILSKRERKNGMENEATLALFTLVNFNSIKKIKRQI